MNAEKPRPYGRRKSDEQLRSLVRALVAAVTALLAIMALGSVFVVATAIKADDAADDASRAAAKASTVAQEANVLARKVESNAATLEDLCQIARRQRKTIVLGLRQSEDFLTRPEAAELPALVVLVREISLPQLRFRVKHEQVPDSCRRRLTDHRSP